MKNIITILNFKLILKMILLLSLIFIASSEPIYAWNPFGNWATTNPYGGNGWNLEKWINEAKNWIDGIEKNKKLSVYSQEVVAYLLTFVSVIAVIYLIYWGFVMMLSAWNEEKVKKTKWIITYVILWILVMWISYSLVLWLFSVFDKS